MRQSRPVKRPQGAPCTRHVGRNSHTAPSRGPVPLHVAMPMGNGGGSDFTGGVKEALRRVGADLRSALNTVVLDLPPTHLPDPHHHQQQQQAAASAALAAAAAAVEVATVLPPSTAPSSATAAAAASDQQQALAFKEQDDEAVAEALEPFSRVRSVPLAGGQLDIIKWRDGGRMLRVWTPHGYTRSDAAREPFPVIYLNDGQNLFDDKLTLSGHAWHAAEAAAGLIYHGQLPPFVIVGIDHSGPTRSYDYLPCPPGTADGFRADAEKWPGGGVDTYLQEVLDEVLPFAEKEYGVSAEPSMRAFGGSSFGGICSLYMALRHPGAFGSYLVESPSLWFGDERLLREDLPAFQGPWPARVFLAMGTQEYSGIRKAKEPEFDTKLVELTHELADALESGGGLTKGSRLKVVLDEGATHTESAWAARLPRALRFLGLHWWRSVMAARKDQLYFTFPRRLQAGQSGVLFFNQGRSLALAGKPRDHMKMAYGFNVDWSVGAGRMPMTPAAGLAALRHEMRQALPKTQTPPQPAQAVVVKEPGVEAVVQEAGKQQQQQQQQQPQPQVSVVAELQALVSEARAVADAAATAASAAEEHGAPAAVAAATAAALAANAIIVHHHGSEPTAATPSSPQPSAAAEPSAAAAAAAAAAGAPQVEAAAAEAAPVAGAAAAANIAGDSPVPFDVDGSDAWLQASFMVPPEAYEMHMAFSDGGEGGQGVWDNNGGLNFYARVRMPMTAAQRSHTVDQALAEGPAWGDVQAIAHKRGGSAFFTTPEVLVAGEPAMLYVNRRRLRGGLSDDPNLKIHFGFNAWAVGGQEQCLKPTSLWRGHDIDWWSVPFMVPKEAADMSFVLTNGHGAWDNNHGSNYVCTVKAPRSAAAAPAVPRGVESVESMPHGEGTLHIVTFTKREGGETARRANKWTEEKRMRVWTPPGWDAASPPPGGYPVLFMQDGQNMFEDWLAHQGVSWRVGYTASDLISRGELPPFVVVAVDSAGAMRSLNYLPYPPGTGAGGFRGDAERWPGGGLEGYMTRLVEEIMPLVQQRFHTAADPAKVAFGGGSFAGVAALYAAMHYPHVFGCVLAESPSLWIAEGRFLQDMRAHRGMLPERLFLGCGTKEYSATRDHVRDDVDGLLLHYCCEAAAVLQSQGLRGDRLRFLVEEGAGHHELAWQWRLTGAMRFLFNSWWTA
ncbi:hypothetical protein HYH02_009298 [Chlamydomonas schloesseri]|uniref:Carbohydrate binding module family 25 domain-containing protein n=1 Tax=Chlamydomonas schloesseri TaxID=2026947 RepID=A0A835TRT8_9CHLO|nr:hypothetical protein HYH02_009298 [Chlamydomonas schloesseri]|eukprot:KAG2443225.1 hypothetical protein HYH02_009298 [Chlamydomonas schloesseri]